MSLPIASSPFAEIVPTCAIDFESADGLESFLSSSTARDDGLVDAALQIHRVHAGGDGLHAFADQRLREHGRGGGAVTGDVGRLRSDFLDHLRAHVLELVGELDLLGDGHAVLGDRRCAEALLEHDVAALRAEGGLDRIGQGVDAAQHASARVFGETDFFGSHWMELRESGMGNGESAEQECESREECGAMRA